MLTNFKYIFVLDAMAIALVLAGMGPGSGALLRAGIILACLASVLHLTLPLIGNTKPEQIPQASHGGSGRIPLQGSPGPHL
ncbi:MAG: hypothetical protein JEZ12_01615 [Desulfobacterium sp.]|nr:hypothetical protein [Desulfobacterium sp.]